MKKLLILTLALGALIPLASAQGDKPQRPHGRHGRLEELSSRLNLTEAQKAQLKSIMEAGRPQMKAIHDDASLSDQQKRAKLKEHRQSVDSQIAGILTAEQKQQFDTIKAERKQHGGQHQKGPGGPGHHGGGPGGQGGAPAPGGA